MPIELSPAIINDFKESGRYDALQAALFNRPPMVLQLTDFNKPDLVNELKQLVQYLPVNTLYLSYFDSFEQESEKFNLLPDLTTLVVTERDYHYLLRSETLAQLEDPDNFGFVVYRNINYFGWYNWGNWD